MKFQPVKQLAVACVALAASVAGARGEPLKDPREAVDVFVEATAAGNAGAIAELYAADAILLAPGAPVFSGREAIQALYQRNMDAGKNSISFGNVRIDGGDGRAVVLWEWRLDIERADGSTASNAGRSLIYFRNAGDGWLIVADMFQPAPR